MNLLHDIKTYGILVTFLMNGALAAQENNTTKFSVQLSIPPKASISLAGSDINYRLTNDKGIEHILSPASAGSVWLNYSSVVEANSTNTIFASLSSGNLPAEVIVKLHVSDDAGAGSGKMGKPSDPIILSNYPQAIITDIGTCYTGQGTKKGHLLTFTWELDPDYDPEDFNIQDLNVEIHVIYTITNND